MINMTASVNYDQPFKAIGAWYEFELLDKTTIRIKPEITGVLALHPQKGVFTVKMKAMAPREVINCPPALYGPPSNRKYTPAELETEESDLVKVERAEWDWIRHEVNDELALLFGVSMNYARRFRKYDGNGCPYYKFNYDLLWSPDPKPGGKYHGTLYSVDVSVSHSSGV